MLVSRLPAAIVAAAIAIGAAPGRAQPAGVDPGAAVAAPADSGSSPSFVVVFLADLGHVVSSPARLNRRAALWTAGALGVAGLLYANDREIFDATQRAQGNAMYDAIAEELGDAIEPVGNMGNTNAFYAAGWLAGHALRVRGLKVIPFQILESHAISGGIRNLAEIAVGRARPAAGLGARHFDPGDGTSFPSGHASVAFELATILSHHARSRPVTALAYGLAGVMALQRVDSESHWPSDVFVAAVTGHVVARTIVRRADARAGGGAGRARVALLPDRCGLRVAVAF
jgi:membrane-associated phospholipid phosphatase